MKRLLVLALAASVAATGLAGADTLITTKQHQDAFAMANRPAKDTTQTTWLAKDRLRITGGDADILVRADQKKLFILDPSAKTGMVVDLPVDVGKIFPAEMKPVFEAMKMAVKVTPTDETQKIGAWTARKYLVELSNPQMKMS